MIALVAAVCSILLAPGPHQFECTTFYLHTINGVRYQSTAVRNMTMPIAMIAECAGEGHPYKVVLKDNGVIVCRDEEAMFSDGLESGDTSAWSKVVY